MPAGERLENEMRTPSDYEHFTVEELTCRCGCGDADMDHEYMEKIVKARKLCGFPWPVTSAKRCRKYDDSFEADRGSCGQGPHSMGRGLDINVVGGQALAVLAACIEVGLVEPPTRSSEDETLGFGGVGLMQHGPSHARRFIHIDNLTPDERPPRSWLWTYPGPR